MRGATARTLEALIGASLGATGGAAASGLAFKPSKPVEWLDEYGEVQSRKLSPIEKQRLKSGMGTAALTGAAVGAGGALGLSRILRRLRTSREGSKKVIEQVKGMYTGPLKEYVTALERRNPRQLGLFPGMKPGDSRRIMAAKDLLAKKESRLMDLLGEARKTRDATLFGGRKMWPYKVLEGKKTTTQSFFSPATHEGQIMNQMFGGPAGLIRANRGPRGVRGHYEQLVEDLMRS